MDKHYVLGVHITDRVACAGKVQELLTLYGCNIQTRIGLHEADRDHCAPCGLVLLELFGDGDTCIELRDKLRALAGVEVQQMLFEHPR